MQGGSQKWVDHSISVTINLPEETSEDLVATLYVTAWQSGCKGLTVYREGSREGILVSDKKGSKGEELAEAAPRKRPQSLDAEILRFKNGTETGLPLWGSTTIGPMRSSPVSPMMKSS
jgi:ribonucleoside-diphosphate reductase alpha chain